MKYLKIMGLCLVAVLALSAVTVASASAQEMELVNKEGKALVKNKFKGESGKGTLEATNGSKITCTKTKFTGKTTNTKEGEAATTFTGCESKGFKCNTEGSGTGEIKTSLTLFIALSGGHWVFFLSILTSPIVLHCTGLQELKVRGGIVIPVTSPEEEKLTKVITINAKQTKGKQEFTKYKIKSEETEKEIFLETEAVGFAENFAFRQSGEETGAVEVEFEEEVKVVKK